MTTTGATASGILGCCGGYAEHFEHCELGMREEAARRRDFMNAWLEPVPEPTPLQRAKEMLRPNVERGARWLDEVKPGWVDLIDLDTLNLEDPCFCICGQAFFAEASAHSIDSYDGFAVAERLLRDAGSHAADYGFGDAVEGVVSADVWRALDELWVELIRARRKETVERLGDVAANTYRDRADATLDAHAERGEA